MKNVLYYTHVFNISQRSDMTMILPLRSYRNHIDALWEQVTAQLLEQDFYNQYYAHLKGETKMQFNMAGIDPKDISLKIDPVKSALVVYVKDKVHATCALKQRYNSAAPPKIKSSLKFGLLLVDIEYSTQTPETSLIDIPISEGKNGEKQFLQE